MNRFSNVFNCLLCVRRRVYFWVQSFSITHPDRCTLSLPLSHTHTHTDCAFCFVTTNSCNFTVQCSNVGHFKRFWCFLRHIKIGKTKMDNGTTTHYINLIYYNSCFSFCYCTHTPHSEKNTRKLCTTLTPSHATRYAMMHPNIKHVYICRIHNNRKIAFDCDQKHFVFGNRKKIEFKLNSATNSWGKLGKKVENNKQRTCVNRNVLASSYLVEMNSNRSRIIVQHGSAACFF